LSCTPQHPKRRDVKRRDVAGGYGRQRRLAAGLRLAAVRPAGGLLAFGDGRQPAPGRPPPAGSHPEHRVAASADSFSRQPTALPSAAAADHS